MSLDHHFVHILNLTIHNYLHTFRILLPYLCTFAILTNIYHTWTHLPYQNIFKILLNNNYVTAFKAWAFIFGLIVYVSFEAAAVSEARADNCL